MPEWIVHLYTGERFCGIQRGVYEEVNKFIDPHELFHDHDVNRVIINGHWIPEALLHLALVCYERWGYEGLKACLHHHILDYSKTLASRGPHGYIVKNYGPSYFIGVLKFAYKVLDYIQKDFSILSIMLREGRDPHDILKGIERSWFGGIEYHNSFLDILRREGLHEFIDNLLRVVKELKGCMSVSIEEVAWLTWRDQEGGMYRDVCPVCKTPVTSPEAYTLIPNEYVRKNLAYKVHVRCFEFLKGKARDFAKEGLLGKDIFRRSLEEASIPPSIAYEVLKSENLIQEWRDIAFLEEGLQRDILLEEGGLNEEWERLKKECVRDVERALARISPAADIISYKRAKIPMPERVSEFYMTLERTLEEVKPDIIRLLKEGRRGEAEKMLKTIIEKMFPNPLITTFPLNAFVGVRDKVVLTIKTIEGLARICELAGVKIDVKTEWSKSELLNILNSVYDKVGKIEKEWINVLRAQIV
jgi:hypothetical protein